jgi:hypothetical protein
VEQGRDGRVGEGRDERTQSLEGGHPNPPRLVAQEVDEERSELRPAHHLGADAADRHEHVGAGLADAPDAVLAQVEELWQLDEKKLIVSVFKITKANPIKLFTDVIYGFS